MKLTGQSRMIAQLIVRNAEDRVRVINERSRRENRELQDRIQSDLRDLAAQLEATPPPGLSLITDGETLKLLGPEGKRVEWPVPVPVPAEEETKDAAAPKGVNPATPCNPT